MDRVTGGETSSSLRSSRRIARSAPKRGKKRDAHAGGPGQRGSFVPIFPRFSNEVRFGRR